MSIVSVDNIQPIGSGTSVTVNNAATLVVGNLNSSGVVTATSFVGGLPITNGADNRVITASSASALTGEANLTFDGNNINQTIDNSGEGIRITASGNHYSLLKFDSNVSSAGGSLCNIQGHWNGTEVANIIFAAGSDTSNKDDGIIKFLTTPSGGSSTERLRIDSSGQIGIGANDNSSYDSSARNVLISSSGNTGITIRSGGSSNYAMIHFADGTSGAAQQRAGRILYEHSTDSLQFSTANTFAFKIDSNGAVTKPNHPVFMAYRVSNYNLTTTESALVYDSEKIDVGGNYNTSNGRFTAPVNGLYEFGYASIAKNTNTVYRYTLKVNGSDPFSPLRLELRLHQLSSEYATNGEFVVYVNMTAGQYAQIYAKSDTNVNDVYGDTGYGYTYFRGRLIG